MNTTDGLSPDVNRAPIELLPQELVTAILIKLDVPALAKFRQVSKAWKAMVDSDSVLKSICVREGLLTSQSQTIKDLKKPVQAPDSASSSSKKADDHTYSALRQQGFSEAELNSYWSLLQAQYERARGLPFRKNAKASVPTLRRRYFCHNKPWPFHGYGVYKLAIDHIDQALITTHKDRYLTITALDTGEVLHRDTAQPFAQLAYSSGWVVATVGQTFARNQFTVWRFDRTLATSSPRRGVLHEHALLSCGQPIEAFHFEFPELVVFTEDSRLNIFDVPTKKLPRSINVTPDIQLKPSERGWKPRCVDADDEYYLVLSEKSIDSTQRLLDSLRLTMDNPDRIEDESTFDWCLQIFSRKTGNLVWRLDPNKGLSPERFSVEFRWQSNRRGARWDQGSVKNTNLWDPNADEDDIDYGLLDAEIMSGNLSGWPPYGNAAGVSHDAKTGSLCLLYGEHLVILSEYKARLKTGFKGRYQPLIVSVSSYGEIEDMSRTTLATGNGLAALNVGKEMILVDLEKLLSGRLQGGSIVRFVSPGDAIDDDDEETRVGDCTSIHLDRTLLAFQNTASKPVDKKRKARVSTPGDSGGEDWTEEEEESDGDRGASVVTVFHLCELGKLRSKGSDIKKEDALLELPA